MSKKKNDAPGEGATEDRAAASPPEFGFVLVAPNRLFKGSRFGIAFDRGVGTCFKPYIADQCRALGYRIVQCAVDETDAMAKGIRDGTEKAALN